MRNPAIALILFLLARTSAAEGTVDFAHVEALLRQAAVGTYLVETLRFAKTGYGTRLGHHFQHLSGSRTGPYTFLATRKDESDGNELRVTICTAIRFLDANGAPTEPTQATRVREVFSSVVLDLPGLSRTPSCSEESLPPDCPAEVFHRIGPGVAPPEIASRVDPILSPGIRGPHRPAVVVEAFIDSSGTVCFARIAKGTHPSLDPAYLDAVRKWRFRPARLREQNVASVFYVAVW
jgi:TonB family protein